MRFGDIPGSSFIKEKLLRSVDQGKMPHAQLYIGVPGALNLPIALAYTQYLHCENKNGVDACGTCPACLKSQKYIHPDTHFVFPIGNLKGDKDADQFKAEMLQSWRAFLHDEPFGDLSAWVNYYGGEDKQVNISRDAGRDIIKSLSLKSFESKYKVMIIWQPEFMHSAAANGILKILEEPPAHTYFLLISNAPDKLMATILSRTQVVQVPLLTDDELMAELKHKQVEESKLARIIQQANGNLYLGLSMAASEEEDHRHETFATWMRACFTRKYIELVELSEAFHGLDKLSQRGLLQYAGAMMRESALHIAGASQINRTRGAELKFIQDFSKVLSIPKIEKISERVSESEYHLERNGSPKMIFLDLSLQLSEIMNPLATN